MPTLWFSRWFEHSWLKRDHFRPPTDRSGISVYIQALTKQLSLDVNDYGVKINSNWSDYSFRFLIPVNYELTPVQISDKDFLRSRNYTELINIEFIKIKNYNPFEQIIGIIFGHSNRNPRSLWSRTTTTRYVKYRKFHHGWIFLNWLWKFGWMEKWDGRFGIIFIRISQSWNMTTYIPAKNWSGLLIRFRLYPV